MKTSLLKKLSAITIASVFFFAAANAQIVYKDIKPNDSVALSSIISSHNIDLNADGIADFNFFNTYSVFGAPDNCPGDGYVDAAYIQPLDSNEAFTVRLNSTVIIDSDLTIPNANFNWDTARTLLVSKTIEPDPFHDCIDGTSYSGYFWVDPPDYIGVRIRKNAKYYYGWMRVHVDKNVSVLAILDYAYNSRPDQPIRPGEKSCTTPTVSLNANGALSFCTGDSVTLTAEGTGYLYQWKRNGVILSGDTSKKFTVKTAGTYRCEVTNSCGSKISTGDTVQISCKGLMDAASLQQKLHEETDQLKIVPNPFSNSTKITFSLFQSQKISVSIFDMTGRLVKIIASAQMQAGTNQLTWNTKDEKGNAVSAGIYFLQIQTENYSETKKLLVN